jgi:hypothetical protein
MSDKEHQPRLLLLHEAGGEIRGRGKYHKLLDKYRREAEDDTEIEYVVEERGPFDPGLSRSVKRYIDTGIVEPDEDDESRDVQETEKGERYTSGFERAKSRLDDSFERTLQRVRGVVTEHGDRSMSDMVQDEEVQSDKELPYGTRLATEADSDTEPEHSSPTPKQNN